MKKSSPTSPPGQAILLTVPEDGEPETAAFAAIKAALRAGRTLVMSLDAREPITRKTNDAGGRNRDARACVALVSLKGYPELEPCDCEALDLLRTLSAPATHQLIQTYHEEGHPYPTLEVLLQIHSRLHRASDLGA